MERNRIEKTINDTARLFETGGMAPLLVVTMVPFAIAEQTAKSLVRRFDQLARILDEASGDYYQT